MVYTRKVYPNFLFFKVFNASYFDYKRSIERTHRVHVHIDIIYVDVFTGVRVCVCKRICSYLCFVKK